MELIQKAAQQFPATQKASEGMNNVRSQLLSKMKEKDELEVDTGTNEKPYPTPVQLNGKQAAQIIQKPREKSVEKLVEDEFFLRSADFSRNTGIRAVVERLSDKYSFRANIPEGVLGDDQMEALKNNSWNKKNVFMKILVKELHNNYTSAKIVSVKTDIETGYTVAT